MKRLEVLDALRGVAAMAVVLFHAQGFWTRSDLTLFDGQAGALLTQSEPASLITYALFGLGFLGVQLFFVISGFCIYLPFANSDRPLKAGQFAEKRFWRLYPAYAFTVLVAFVLVVAREGFGHGEATLTNLTGNLLFWYYDWPPSETRLDLLVVFWSLTVEVQFYIIFVVTLPIIRRVGVARAAVASGVMGILYSALWHSYPIEAIEFFSPHNLGIARYGEWLLGAWIAESVVRRGGAATVRLPRMWIASGGAFLGASVAIVSLQGLHYTALDVPGSIGCALLLVGLVNLELIRPPLSRSMTSAVAQWLGARSYSLYLIHYPVMAVIGEVVARVLSIPDKDAAGGTLLWGVVTIVSIIASVVAADLMYRVIERPSHARGRAVWPGPDSEDLDDGGSAAARRKRPQRA